MNKENFKTFLVPIISFILFIFVTWLVCSFKQITALDIQIMKYLQNSSVMDIYFADNISAFNHIYSSLILLTVSLFLIYKKDLSLAFMYFICNYTVYGITLFIKNIIQRHRPPFELQGLYHLHDYSFPSGHSFSIMLCLGMLICIIFKYVDNRVLKYFSSAICLLLVFMVGLSRLILGVHYPTDVLAGFLLGITLISLVWIIDKKRTIQ
ncbi:phosphatase PAP2 family protein [bacterium]|nr:phosphatase PAP2 family protein [bacterium]